VTTAHKNKEKQNMKMIGAQVEAAELRKVKQASRLC